MQVFGKFLHLFLAYLKKKQYLCTRFWKAEGALAHLVERNVRNVKVRGSSPLCSTKTDILVPEKCSFE